MPGGTVHPWPNPGMTNRAPPARIVRPCDWGLVAAVQNLETQVGTVEAYNRLCDAAARLKRQIDAGQAKPQNPLYATSVRG